MKNRLVIGLFLFLLVASACDRFAGPNEKAAICVGDEKISLTRVQRDLEEFRNEMGVARQDMAPVMEQLLQRLVDKYLILAYGRERHIEVEPAEFAKIIHAIQSDYASEEIFKEMLLKRYVDFEEWKNELHDQLLISRIIDDGLNAGIRPVTFQEIEKHYNENIESFHHPEMVRFRQIVVKTVGEAQGLLDRIDAGKTLEELIREAPKSCETAVVMSERWAAREELEETLAKAVFGLPLGLAGKPVGTPYGFHVVEVTETRAAGIFPLPDVMETIEKNLLNQKKEAYYREWLAVLRTRYPVKIHHEVIETMGGWRDDETEDS